HIPEVAGRLGRDDDTTREENALAVVEAPGGWWVPVITGDVAKARGADGGVRQVPLLTQVAPRPRARVGPQHRLPVGDQLAGAALPRCGRWAIVDRRLAVDDRARGREGAVCPFAHRRRGVGVAIAVQLAQHRNGIGPPPALPTPGVRLRHRLGPDAKAV